MKERRETVDQYIRRLERVLAAGKFPRVSDRRRDELAASERLAWRRALADFRADAWAESPALGEFRGILAELREILAERPRCVGSTST